MPAITHVFFDMHGTLVDPYRLHPCYSQSLGKVMAARFGGDPAVWAEANRRIMADWDSYYADLDLSGPDSLSQMWEGQTRTMRAMFRLAGRPYPPADVLQTLIREYHYQVTRSCDVLYPDVYPALRVIHDELPLVLGVVSDAVQGHLAGCLAGAGVHEWFAGPIIGPDVVGHFGKDAAYFRFAFMRAGASPAACLIVDDSADAVAAATLAGAHTVFINRTGRDVVSAASGVELPDLSALPDLLR